MTITSIIDQLIRDEGERLSLYYDEVGVPTIGVGCNLTAGRIPDALAQQITITPSASRALLDVRVRDCLQDLSTLPWVAALSECRRAVLVNVAFNVGFHGLLGFHAMLTAMQGEDWHLAADELLDSKAAQQNPNRYARLAQQLREDTWV